MKVRIASIAVSLMAATSGNIAYAIDELPKAVCPFEGELELMHLGTGGNSGNYKISGAQYAEYLINKSDKPRILTPEFGKGWGTRAGMACVLKYPTNFITLAQFDNALAEMPLVGNDEDDPALSYASTGVDECIFAFTKHPTLVKIADNTIAQGAHFALWNMMLEDGTFKVGIPDAGTGVAGTMKYLADTHQEDGESQLSYLDWSFEGGGLSTVQAAGNLSIDVGIIITMPNKLNEVMVEAERLGLTPFGIGTPIMDELVLEDDEGAAIKPYEVKSVPVYGRKTIATSCTKMVVLSASDELLDAELTAGTINKRDRRRVKAYMSQVSGARQNETFLPKKPGFSLSFAWFQKSEVSGIMDASLEAAGSSDLGSEFQRQ